MSSKIAIVTYCDQNYQEIGDISIPNKRAYAQKHGYDFIIETHPIDPRKHVIWNRLLILIRMIAENKWDWIFWTDADSLIDNDEIRLEDIIGSTDKDFIISKDHNGINAGQLFFRSCQWSIDFLREADSRTEFYNHVWKEQEAMRNVLFNPIHESHVYYIDKRKINSFGHVQYLDYQPGDFMVHFPGEGGVGSRSAMARLMRRYDTDIKRRNLYKRRSDMQDGNPCLNRKDECTFVCHLGLGDLILCSAIAVYLSGQYKTVYFPSSAQHMDSVRSFFILHPDIKVYECSNYPDPYKNCVMRGDIFRTGFYGWDKQVDLPVDNNISFAENFYRQVGLDYSIRWDYSPIPEIASRFYNAKLSNAQVKYSFVHDDPNRGFCIKPHRLCSLPTIRPNNPEGSILAYIPLICNAWEIHVIDSSVMHLVESLDLNPDIKLFYHKYARPVRRTLYENGRWNDYNVPTRKNWNVFN